MSSSPVATEDHASGAPRRTSGRVRRQPRDIYAASAGGAKRKRSAANGRITTNQAGHDDDDGMADVQMPDDYVSDDEIPEEDDEPDEEELRELRRARKQQPSSRPRPPPQKKSKVNGTTALPIRSAKTSAPKRAPRKRKGPVTLDLTDAEGLFARVFASADRLDDVAGRWIQDFKFHESRALADVINFVLKCAGCSLKVVEEDIEDPDAVSTRLTDIQEEFQASEPTDYPLIAKGRAATSFRDTMNGFILALIKAIAATDLLYGNTALIENIQVWFSTMSSAANRAFRHTATFASLAVISALCQVGRENAQEVAAKQRQAENERSKSRPNKGRVKDMEQRVAQDAHLLEFIETQLVDWFDVVFIHRYRDVDPAVRRDCMGALGDWIVAMPEVFFDGQHLRYLGWVLSDVAAATRGEVIKQLSRLYRETSMIGGLKTFTERFRMRLVEIATSDADSTVRCAGIELLNLLRENGLLEPDDVDAIGRLLYDSDPRVRKAVARFFAEIATELYDSKLDDLGGLEALEDALPELGEANFEAPRLAWLKYKSLAEMMAAYDTDESPPDQMGRLRGDDSLTLHIASVESRFTLAANVLYDEVDEVEDWQALAGYLLFDHSSRRSRGSSDGLVQFKKECTLSDTEEMILLHVVSASVKRAMIDLGEKAATAKTKLTKKQREELSEEQEAAVRELAALILKLLKKFGNSPSTAAIVLKMENVLNLPSLKELPQDATSYGLLLDDIRKLIMSYGTDEVLAPATDAILHAKSYGDLDDVTEEKLSIFWEDVVSNLGDLIDPKTITIRGASDLEELSALSNNLLRISRLSQVSNCIAPLEDATIAQGLDATGADYQGAIDYIIAFVQRALPSDSSSPTPEEALLEDQIAARAAEASLRYMQWKFNQIKDLSTSSTSGAGVTFEALEALATRRDAYFNHVLAALQARKPTDEVALALASCLLDLATSAKVLKTFAPRHGVSTDYEVLVVDMPASALQAVMAVFAAAEKAFAKASGKRVDGPSAAEAQEEDLNADPIDDEDDDENGTDHNADPLSDSDDDDAGDDEDAAAARAAAKAAKVERRLRTAIFAERRLCEFTRCLVFAVHAGALEAGPTRARLERNKARLGPNFKEVLAYLDLGAMAARLGGGKKGTVAGKAVASGKAKAGQGKREGGSKERRNFKSNAIVADDEVEDEIEDDEDVEEEGDGLRSRGLVDGDENLADEDEIALVPAGDEDEEEEDMLGD